MIARTKFWSQIFSIALFDKFNNFVIKSRQNLYNFCLSCCTRLTDFVLERMAQLKKYILNWTCFLVVCSQDPLNVQSDGRFQHFQLSLDINFFRNLFWATLEALFSTGPCESVGDTEFWTSARRFNFCDFVKKNS